MPGITTPQMALILPKLGDDRNAWDDLLNAALIKIDSHNHAAGNGVQVTPAGLNINADLPFGGFGPTNLGKAAFSAVAALTTGARTLFVDTADGELYWRTNGGVNVKLTSGSSLNISLVGGIAGDYTTAGAELYYDEASKTYRFTSAGSPKLWARIAAGAVRITKFGTSDAFYAGLEVDATIAANYTITLPATIGAGLAQLTGAGAMSFSYSLPNNQALTFVGTGKINHANKYVTVDPGRAYFRGTGTGSLTTADTYGLRTYTLSTGPGGQAWFDISELKPGDRVQAVVIAYTTSASLPTIQGTHIAYEDHAGFTTTNGSQISGSNGLKYLTATVDTPTPLGIYRRTDYGASVPDMAMGLRIGVSANSNSLVIYSITIIYDSTDVPFVTV